MKFKDIFIKGKTKQIQKTEEPDIWFCDECGWEGDFRNLYNVCGFSLACPKCFALEDHLHEKT